MLMEQVGRPLLASVGLLATGWGRAALLGQQQLQSRQQSSRTASTSAGSSGRPAYELEVSIKAFEQRYLNQASTAVRDLMFINLAPQALTQASSSSSNSSSSKSTAPGPPSPVNLAMPIEHHPIRLNWKRSRFTVIRGPHIDKKGREQFEMRKYKVVVRGATHSAQDVHWFLDSVRLYEFPGVQIQVSITSNTYLTPLPAAAVAAGAMGAIGRGAEEDARSPSLLAEHRRRIARYLVPGKIAAQRQAIDASTTGPGDATEAVLRSLRQVGRSSGNL